MSRISTYLYFIVVAGILLVLAGVIYEEHGFNTTFSIFTRNDISSFLKELGFACIIGFLVSVIIERAARDEEVLIFDRYIKESGKNVLKAVYGHNVSDTLFDFLDKHILSLDFVRSEITLTFSVNVCKDEIEGEYVKLTLQTALTIINISPTEKEFKGYVAVEKTDAPRSTETNAIEYIRTIPKDGRLKVDSAHEESSKFKKMNYSITVTPDKPLRVHALSTVSKLTTDSNIWRAAFVTEKCHITVHYPPEELELRFELMHAEYDGEIHSLQSAGSIIIAIDQPLLPHNGIILWWSKKKQEAVPKNES
jgi:hypothetical protein